MSENATKTEEKRAARPEKAGSTRKPRRRRLVIAGIVVLVVIGLGWMTMSWAENTGWKFFHHGRDIVQTLALMAKALEAGDVETFGGFFADEYHGSSLGFGDLRLADDRDGVRRYHFHGGDARDREAALEEWREYLATMDRVEEIQLHVHRLESWDSREELAASVRFELIGTPAGEPRAGIDRALLSMRFTTHGDGLRVVAAELREGDRVIADEPHFVDVAPAAGVDFENQYYPPFLSENREEPLKFAMLKYGPAGITAVDYDDDGFYDLFIPDGVESRLYRNPGDGTRAFEDVTAAAGLSGLSGVGVALFADYDNDGFKDAFISRTFEPNQIFHNNGDGTFTDVTAEAGIDEDCCTTVASWADYDNDGWLDLYVGRYLDPRLAIPTTFYARNGEPNQLYHNNGDGTFTNVTVEAGVGEVGLCLGSVFGDYDDDGDPDLYVVNDFGRKTLYRNEGDGTFTDVTVETGTLAYGAGMSASFGDYDNDADLDIYVAHIRSDYGWFAEWPTVMRYMFNTWRQGVWKTDMPLYLQILRQSGLDFVDVFQQMAAGNTLLRNNGDGTFDDVSWETGANPPGWFWGSNFVDFDNDGWQDIYSANGWVYNNIGTEIELDFLNNVVSEMEIYKTGAFFDPANFGIQSWHGWERNRHLRSRGPGEDGEVRFEEIGRATGTDLLLNSRGIAVADFWNRGVLDMAVAASTDRHALLRNDVGQRRNWLAVELAGAGPELANGTNRDAVGARVVIRIGEDLQMREVVLGDGYGSQNTLRLYFGLGDADAVDEMIVKWPRSGIVQRFEGFSANRILEVTEGRDELVEKTYGTVEQPFAAPEEEES